MNGARYLRLPAGQVLLGSTCLHRRTVEHGRHEQRVKAYRNDQNVDDGRLISTFFDEPQVQAL